MKNICKNCGLLFAALALGVVPSHAVMNGLGQDIFPVAAVFQSSATVLDARGLLSPSVGLAAGVLVSSEASPALGAGVNVSTNVYIVGFSSAAKYYGDGSALTGIAVTGDSLGTHTATSTLNMTGFEITGVSTITVSSVTTTSAGVVFSTNVYFISGRVGIGTANPSASLDVSGTGAIKVPVGTTAQRPASPVAGMIRLNSDTGKLEYYNGTSWYGGTVYAVGGSVAEAGGYRIHTYTTSGSLDVEVGGSVEYLVVAGGGGGGYNYGGAGGAGGFRTGSLTVTPGAKTVTVGAGGAGSTGGGTGSTGGNSVFDSITAVGGGGGGSYSNAGASGGSGGGGGDGYGGGSGTSGPPVQGYNGGASAANDGGGGGGSSAAGGNAVANTQAGNGGAGTASSISGSVVTYAGGGGGGASGAGGNKGSGGSGGGGEGGQATTPPTAGAANTGGGGGGGGTIDGGSLPGAAGGSGIVIIRYPI